MVLQNHIIIDPIRHTPERNILTFVSNRHSVFQNHRTHSNLINTLMIN